MSSQLVFDVGMYDGEDTAYYLSKGCRVVSIEANPILAERACQRFRTEILSGRLTVENVAVAETAGTALLHLCGEDPGSSSIIEWRVAHRRPEGTVAVRSVSIETLLGRYGVPYYLKCDIEGADRHCVLGLRRNACPPYLSFEVGEDFQELLEYTAQVGYSSFKIINQMNFRELARFDSVTTRLADRLSRTLRPSRVRSCVRDGFMFTRGHSSGPMAERTDGCWRTVADTRARYREFCARYARSARGGWFDLHARFG